MLSAPFGIEKKFVYLPNLSHDFFCLLYTILLVLLSFTARFTSIKGTKAEQKKLWKCKQKWMNERKKYNNTNLILNGSLCKYKYNNSRLTHTHKWYTLRISMASCWQRLWCSFLTLAAQEKYKNGEKKCIGKQNRKKRWKFCFAIFKCAHCESSLSEVAMVVVSAAAAAEWHLSERNQKIVFGVLTKSFKCVERMQPLSSSTFVRSFVAVLLHISASFRQRKNSLL